MTDLIERLWQDLLDKSDRTSPAEYPDMALITRDELADYVSDAGEEFTALFELRRGADMRAIKRWQAAEPGRDLTWPDHADLLVWLLEREGAATAFVAQLARLTHSSDAGYVEPDDPDDTRQALENLILKAREIVA